MRVEQRCHQKTNIVHKIINTAMAGSQGFAGNYALWMFPPSLGSLWSHGNARKGAVQLEPDIQHTARRQPCLPEPLGDSPLGEYEVRSPPSQTRTNTEQKRV